MVETVDHLFYQWLLLKAFGPSVIFWDFPLTLSNSQSFLCWLKSLFDLPDGYPLTAAAKYIGDASVLMAKAIAFKEGLHTAWLQQIPQILVEGDSKVLIDCINGKSASPWCLISIL
ncbi:hypothetical protein ACLB2K_011635 [Fragaria x ananassa]